MLKNLVGLMLVLCSHLGFASTETQKSFDVFTKDSEGFSVRAFYYVNKFGGPEIRLESARFPRLNSKINAILGYGRDLNDDHLVDTWFLIHPEKGVQIIFAECALESCDQTITRKVFNNYEHSERMLAYSAYAGLMGYFFMSLTHRYEKSIDFYQEYVDLEEFRLRLEREMDADFPSLTRLQMREALAAIVYGHEENLKMLNKAKGNEAIALLSGDVAIHAVGGFFLKFLARPFMAFESGFKNYIGKFGLTQTKTYEALKLRFDQFSFSSKLVGAALVQKMNRTLFKETLRGGLMAMKKRSLLKRAFAVTGSKTLRALKAGAGQWKYLTLNSGIQLTAETYANYDDVYDQDPLVMGSNVLNNKSIQQNVAYMASETFLMTMAVKTFKQVKTRYAVCAFIAITNSIFMNYVMRDEVDPQRVVLDTTWEMLIGSSQVQFDQFLLDKFERIGQESGNTKLKFLGYAAVVLEQGVGYVAYSKAPALIEKASDKVEVALAPIFVKDSVQ